MQLQAFRYFVATADAGSIRAASETLHVAASAISRQIALLEDEFGAPLFERHAAGMSLTQAGVIVLRAARSALLDIERMRSEVDDLQNCRRGHIRIASSEGAVSSLLFAAISDFSKQFPGVTIEIVTSGSRVALDALLNQTCDIAVAFDPEPNAEIDIVASARQPVVVVANARDGRVPKRKVALANLGGLRLCLLDQSFAVRRLFDRVVRETGVKITPALTINSIAFAKQYVSLGMGVALMPLYAVSREVREGALQALRLDHSAFDRSTVALCRYKHRALPLPAREFLDDLSQRFKSFASS